MPADKSFTSSLNNETWEKLRALKEQTLKEDKISFSTKEVMTKESKKDPLEENNVQNEKKSWIVKREEYRTVIEWLCKTFSNAFNYTHPLPLKLHITKDLYSHLPIDGSISKVKLRASIQYYTHSTSYLKSLLNSTHRVDLEGKEFESILESHKEFTQNILNLRQEKKKTLKPKGFVKKKPYIKKPSSDI